LQFFSVIAWLGDRNCIRPVEILLHRSQRF